MCVTDISVMKCKHAYLCLKTSDFQLHAGEQLASPKSELLQILFNRVGPIEIEICRGDLGLSWIMFFVETGEHANSTQKGF